MRPVNLWRFCRRSTTLAVSPLEGLTAALLFALPGALLACIIHCSLPARGYHSYGREVFLCDHMPDTGADLPQPVSADVVQALVQSLATAAMLAIGALTLLPQQIHANPLALRARLADSPPKPPPRLAIAL
ncbi:MAG: hypothetical protein HGA45_25210 [Chloroflexales bacterium]|nr:hypothetical protein [Chloroflexales bacterium]